MDSVLASLRIAVRFSPSTNDHEVCFYDGEEPLLPRFAPGLIGLDPADVLVVPCPLLVAKSEELIARCDCGEVGCGAQTVLIERAGDVVTWTSTQPDVNVRFAAAQYLAEVSRALADFSWETPDRTAARLIEAGVDRAALARHGLRFQWASGRIREGKMSVSLEFGERSQALVHLPWNDRTPAAIAEACLENLAREPSSWSDVTTHALELPAIAGPGWRRESSSGGGWAPGMPCPADGREAER